MFSFTSHSGRSTRFRVSFIHLFSHFAGPPSYLWLDSDGPLLDGRCRQRILREFAVSWYIMAGGRTIGAQESGLFSSQDTSQRSRKLGLYHASDSRLLVQTLQRCRLAEPASTCLGRYAYHSPGTRGLPAPASHRARRSISRGRRVAEKKIKKMT